MNPSRLRRRRPSWRVAVVKGYRDTVEVQLVPGSVRKPTWFGERCVTVARLDPSAQQFEDTLAQVVSEAEGKAAMLRTVG